MKKKEGKEKERKGKEKERKGKERGRSRQALFQSVFRNVLRVNGSDPMTSLLCGEAN
jgi:hypothetical protein